MREKLYNKFKASPIILAFLNGVLVSAGINLLTGITSSDNLLQIIFSSICAVSFIIASTLMIVWQNKSSIVQEKYEKWKDCIKKNKEAAGEVIGVNDKDDWNTFLDSCCDYEFCKNNANKVGNEYLIKLNYNKLCLLYVFMWILFALGMITLALSVIFAFYPV